MHKFQHIGETLLWSWCKGALQNRIQGCWQFNVERRYRWNAAAKWIKRMIACEHLIEDDSTTVLVAPRINNAVRLFWCHVSDRPTYSDRLTDTCAWFQRAGDAEVCDDQAMIFLMKQ